MCGIVAGLHIGARKDEPVNQFIIDQYQDQFSRGQRGFGIVRINNDKKIEVDRATEPTKAMLDLYMKQATMMIFHHRTPTSSENWLSQTHPIQVVNGSLAHNYLVVHNGVVRNDDEKRKEHLELGYTYTTDYVDTWGNTERQKFNDSEAVAIEVARFIEEQSNRIDIEGSAAFIALQCDKEWKAEQIFFGRNDSNPLNMAKTRTHMYLSSEGPGNEVTPYVLYGAKIGDEKLKLSRRPFKMAEKKETSYTLGYATGYNTTQPTSQHISTEYPRKESYTSRMEKISNDSKKNKKEEEKSEFEFKYPYDDEPTEMIHYQEIMTTVGMFFEELDYGTCPEVEWYMTQIRKQFENALQQQEYELIKEAGKTPLLPEGNANAI